MQTQTIPKTTFNLQQLDIPPGNAVRFRDISWHEFESILAAMEDGYAVRFAYHEGTLEIKMPSPGHEDDKEIIGDLLKALLEECDREFRSLGSTTFKSPNMTNAIEPDQCFYITNEAAIRGKRQRDLSIDPPPDLAIEIDNTSDSRLRFNSYQALGVGEVWRYDGTTIEIYLLGGAGYEKRDRSAIFPDIPIGDRFREFLEQSRTLGRTKALKAFRKWIGRCAPN